jgi:NAD(P)-dependent dehydrogenase (short-subunit alcohol dehydrogenase family)
VTLPLEGLVALVTGAADGIGNAIARGLVGAGASLAAVDLNEVDVEALRATCAAPASQRVAAWRCDVTSSPAVAETCAAAAAALGPVSILVNNAGGSGSVRIQNVEDMTDEVWDHVLSLNLTSGMRFCRSLVGAMKTQGFGRIVNVSSTLKDGVFGPVGTLGGRLPYITAKSALVGFTRQLAKDLGPCGITVNAVAPGLTLPGPESRITKKFEALPEEDRRRLTANIPAGRLATGEDMANAVCFLCTPASAYVNGQVIAVNGG